MRCPDCRTVAVLPLLLLSLLLLIAGFGAAEKFFADDFSKFDWIHSQSSSDFGKFEHLPGEGIKTSQDAHFYAVGKKFEKPFSNKDRNLIIQYSVRHPQNIDCGGGYIKLFDGDFDAANFDGKTPYVLMFGPDICGSTKKVHAIFRYNDKEVHKRSEVRCEDDTYTHTYTLKLNKDNSYEMLIDGESKAKGDLEKDFPFLADKKIKDPAAKKPSDWIDAETIDDPNDTKPDDWDQPKTIPDPDDKKPDDWEDDDGDWEPKLIDNPAYKGEWTPKQIPNPEYKGAWKHPMIDNPEYKPDAELYWFRKEVGGIGFDLWQVKSGTIFGHVLVTDDEAEAKKGVEAADEIRRMEKAKDDEEREKRAKEAESSSNVAADDDAASDAAADDADEADESSDDEQVPKPIVESHDEL